MKMSIQIIKTDDCYLCYDDNAAHKPMLFLWDNGGLNIVHHGQNITIDKKEIKYLKRLLEAAEKWYGNNDEV